MPAVTQEAIQLPPVPQQPRVGRHRRPLRRRPRVLLGLRKRPLGVSELPVGVAGAEMHAHQHVVWLDPPAS